MKVLFVAMALALCGIAATFVFIKVHSRSVPKIDWYAECQRRASPGTDCRKYADCVEQQKLTGDVCLKLAKGQPQ